MPEIVSDTHFLRVDALTYTYPGATVPALKDVSFAMERGECLCLTGNSGCGKTTLLLALKGLLHEGSRCGEIDIAILPGHDGRPPSVGLVFQNPESQILCTTVSEEIAFGPENLCVPPDEIGRRIRNSLRSVGLEGCDDRHVDRFSAGQKQRLAIAAVLAMHPSLLLLDEPTSQLDGPGKRKLCSILAELKRRGYTILVTEHDPRPFAAIIDRYLIMENGKITGSSTTIPTLIPEATGRIETPGPAAIDGAAAISATGVSLTYPETGAGLTDVTLQVRPGERLHLFGGNGAGKSTLLRCLAGLETPDEGTIEVAGIGSPRPEKLPGKVGFLFQNPARQLFADSVQEEVEFTLARIGYGRGERERMTTDSLALCGISHLAERAPLTLSFGEQHRVALAAVVAPRPRMLLLDEPFAGLDIPQRLTLLAILAEMSGKYGTTVVIASHDELPDPAWADRVVSLSGGTIVEA